MIRIIVLILALSGCRDSNNQIEANRLSIDSSDSDLTVDSTSVKKFWCFTIEHRQIAGYHITYFFDYPRRCENVEIVIKDNNINGFNDYNLIGIFLRSRTKEDSINFNNHHSHYTDLAKSNLDLFKKMQLQGVTFLCKKNKIYVKRDNKEHCYCINSQKKTVFLDLKNCLE